MSSGRTKWTDRRTKDELLPICYSPARVRLSSRRLLARSFYCRLAQFSIVSCEPPLLKLRWLQIRNEPNLSKIFLNIEFVYFIQRYTDFRLVITLVNFFMWSYLRHRMHIYCCLFCWSLDCDYCNYAMCMTFSRKSSGSSQSTCHCWKYKLIALSSTEISHVSLLI